MWFVYLRWGGGKSGIGGITSKVEKPEFSLQGISKNMQVLEGGGGGTLRYLFDPFGGILDVNYILWVLLINFSVFRGYIHMLCYSL